MTPSALLDDVAALDAGDPGGMLLAVASSAAQVREAALLTAEAGVDRLLEDGRPRAVVVCGMGGSGLAGDVLAGVAGALLARGADPEHAVCAAVHAHLRAGRRAGDAHGDEHVIASDVIAALPRALRP